MSATGRGVGGRGVWPMLTIANEGGRGVSQKLIIAATENIVWFGLVMWTNRRACWCYKRSHWPMTGIRWNMYSHLVFYYIFPPEFEISHFLGWIKSPRLRLGDFIQPKKCEISNSGGNIFCKLETLLCGKDIFQLCSNLPQLFSKLFVCSRGCLHLSQKTQEYLSSLPGEAKKWISQILSHTFDIFRVWSPSLCLKQVLVSTIEEFLIVNIVVIGVFGCSWPIGSIWRRSTIALI